MGDEPVVASMDDAKKAARASLDASLPSVIESAAAGDVGDSADPGATEPVEAQPEAAETQPATSAGGDLPVPTGETAAQDAQPSEKPAAASAAEAVPIERPEVEAPLEEPQITTEGIREAMGRLYDEREDYRARCDELEATRKIIARDQEELATIQKSVGEIETVIRENEVILRYHFPIYEKNKEDLDLREKIQELRGTIAENRGLLADYKWKQRELLDRVDRTSRAYTEGAKQLRGFTIGVMREGYEQKREQREIQERVKGETKAWTDAFDRVWSEAKLPGDIKADVNKYLAAHGAANKEMFWGPNALTYVDFIRRYLPNVARIYGHGRDKAVETYADQKRADAKQAVPKLKPSTGTIKDDDTTSAASSPEEIQREARAKLRKSLGVSA